MLFSLLHAFVNSKPIVTKPPRDDQGYKHRAGCLVVSRDGQRVLLVTSSGKQGKWIVPAGTLESGILYLDSLQVLVAKKFTQVLGENPESGALRETEEEAGVSGIVLAQLGDVDESEITGKNQITHYYLVEARKEHSDFLEGGFRERAWFYLDDARRELSYRPHYITLLKRFEEDLRRKQHTLSKEGERKHKEEQKEGKKAQVKTRKQFLLKGMHVTKQFAALVTVFGAEKTSHWLARIGQDPRSPVRSFDRLRELLATESLPPPSAQSDKAEREVELQWRSVVARIEDCSERRSLRHQSKCYKQFLSEAWQDERLLFTQSDE